MIMSFPPAFRKKRLAINAVASFAANTKVHSHRDSIKIDGRRRPAPAPRRSKPIVEGNGPE
jgi:hypothetical protein